MAMNLIDRPHLDQAVASHRGLSATASAALHAAAAVTLVAVLRVSSPVPSQSPVTAALLADQLIWFPHDAGGGRDDGGQRSIEPPRRARAIGVDPISVATTAQPQPSTDSAIEPPEEVSTIPAQPLGDATQILAGAIDGRGVSPGPGDAGVGTSPGNHDGGLGNQPAGRFGDGALPGGGPGVTLPVPTVRASPKYTVEAMQARIQGVVTIECVVLPDGTVGDTRVMRSLDRRFGLDEEAIAAAKRWRFRPGMLRGTPVPVVVTIELIFNVR